MYVYSLYLSEIIISPEHVSQTESANLFFMSVCSDLTEL